VPTVDPQELVSRLEAEGVEVTEVGAEDVRGVATTRYAVTLPADATDAAAHNLSGDVWIDADGLVRRVELRGAGDTPFTMTAELFDIGRPVTVTTPPADQVTDLGSLDASGLFGPKHR
jgi:hypothetical protein